MRNNLPFKALAIVLALTVWFLAKQEEKPVEEARDSGGSSSSKDGAPKRIREEEVEKKLQEIMERYDLLTSHEGENDKK